MDVKTCNVSTVLSWDMERLPPVGQLLVAVNDLFLYAETLSHPQTFIPRDHVGLCSSWTVLSGRGIADAPSKWTCAIFMDFHFAVNMIHAI